MAGKGRTLTVYLAADSKKAKKEVAGFASFLKSDFVKGIGVATVALGAFNYAMEGIKGGAAEADELAKLNTVLRNLGFAGAAAEVQAWVDNTMYATNVTDTELRGALERLLPVTQSVTESQRLLSIAIDAAAGSGKPLATVVEAISKAAAGSSTALVKLFPELRNVAGAATNANTALAALNTSYGGSAAASVSSYAGQIANVKLALDELQESFGTGFLDSFSEAVGGSDDAARGLTDALRDLQPVMDTVGGIFGEYLGNVVNIAKGLTDATKAVEDFADSNVIASGALEIFGKGLSFVANGPVITVINQLGGLINQLNATAAAAQFANGAITSIGGGDFGSDSYFGGTPTAGYSTESMTRQILATRRWAAARANATAAVRNYGSAAGSAASSVDRMTEAERKAADALAKHVAAFRSMRDTVYTDIADLNKAVQSYSDAWVGAFDDINGRLNGGNDIAAWYDQYQQLAGDIAEADKAVDAAIRQGNADVIAAANDRRKALGALPTLQDYVAGKVQANTDKASLISTLFPSLVGTTEGRQILDSFTNMAPEAVKSFVSTYGQENIIQLAALFAEQNATGTGPVAKMFADAGYWNGVNEAKQVVVGMQEQLLADEAKLRRAGAQAGKAIGAGLKAEIIRSYNEAMDTIGGSGGDPIARSLSIQRTMVTATRRLGI
jgi:hypothetical protein